MPYITMAGAIKMVAAHFQPQADKCIARTIDASGANGAAAAAFLAAGHGVIDVAAMLGLRVDAHPGSTAGGTDGLHFCMPGPLDYALDIVLARVGSAFDSVVPEIDGAE